MLALHPSPTSHASARRIHVRKRSENRLAAVPAGRVKELLREIAIALHATRVVGWKNGTNVPKKG